MKPLAVDGVRRRSLLAGLAALLCMAGSTASASMQVPPLPGARLAGQGLLRVWGFEVYRARLWIGPGFDASDHGAAPLALELEYLRNFEASAIARRSIQEMRRQQPLSDEQARRWQRALESVLPDVKAGDALTGLYRPGEGAVFLQGQRVLGEVADPLFARLFFGIWLSPATSEPALREALLAGAGRT
ncbi:chalcone isomerase family protein [Hydrogenophaga aquatica]